MNILVIIGIVVAIIGIILIVLINQYNKFQWTNVLVNKGETNLETAFTKKHNVLMRYLDILKDNKITIPDEDYEEYKLINLKQSIDKLNKKIDELNNYINKIMDNNEKLLELMHLIGRKRGALISGGNIDEEKTANIILDDFRSGKLGKITIETIK